MNAKLKKVILGCALETVLVGVTLAAMVVQLLMRVTPSTWRVLLGVVVAIPTRPPGVRRIRSLWDEPLLVENTMFAPCLYSGRVAGRAAAEELLGGDSARSGQQALDPVS